MHPTALIVLEYTISFFATLAASLVPLLVASLVSWLRDKRVIDLSREQEWSIIRATETAVRAVEQLAKSAAKHGNPMSPADKLAKALDIVQSSFPTVPQDALVTRIEAAVNVAARDTSK